MTPNIEHTSMNNRIFEVILTSSDNEPMGIDAQTIREWLEDCHTKGLRVEVNERTGTNPNVEQTDLSVAKVREALELLVKNNLGATVGPAGGTCVIVRMQDFAGLKHYLRAKWVDNYAKDLEDENQLLKNNLADLSASRVIQVAKPTGRRYKTVLALLKGEGFAKPFIAKYRKLSGGVLKDRSRKRTASAIDKQVTSRTNSKVASQKVNYELRNRQCRI